LRIIGRDTLLSQIDDVVVAEFIARRRGEAVQRRGKLRAPPGLVSAATVNRSVTALQTVMTHARDRWRVVGKPIHVATVDWRRHRLKERSVETYLTRDQAEALLKALIPHAKTPARLALYTGLRRSEVLGLDWQRVDLTGARLTLIKKGGRVHSVALIPEAVALLEDLEPNPADRRGPAFFFGNPHVGCACVSCRPDTKRGQELAGQRIRWIKRAYGTARKAIGLPSLRFHDLRHTVASWLLQRGYTLKTVQQVLGHADIGTTARYAHLEHGAVATAMADALGSGALKGVDKANSSAASWPGSR
jgi:integrase